LREDSIQITALTHSPGSVSRVPSLKTLIACTWNVSFWIQTYPRVSQGNKSHNQHHEATLLLIWRLISDSCMEISDTQITQCCFRHTYFEDTYIISAIQSPMHVLRLVPTNIVLIKPDIDITAIK
jgi:hypothetical protein